MNTAAAILFLVGLALLYLHVEAGRFALDGRRPWTNSEAHPTSFHEHPKSESLKTESKAHAGRKLEAVNSAANNIKPNNEDEKSSTYGNPVTGSVPATDTSKDNQNSSPSSGTATDSGGSRTDEETNNSYGSYGNPSGSSTETHHVYPNNCRPGKKC